MSMKRMILGTFVAFTLSTGTAFAATNSRMCEIAYSWYEQGGWWSYFWGYAWAFSGC